MTREATSSTRAIAAIAAAMRQPTAGLIAPAMIATRAGITMLARNVASRLGARAAGGAIHFWRIALRPGKPMLAGRVGGAQFLGLPGNPVSAFVTCELFVKPLVRALAGAADPLPRVTAARMAEPLPANGPRADYLRGWRDRDGLVRVARVQDSSMLLTLACAQRFDLPADPW